MTVRFPDLNQWHKVRAGAWGDFAHAYPVAACRASMGVTEVDPYWREFLAGCHEHGIGPIAYHRLRPNMPVVAQVSHFLRTAGPHCAYALDVESTVGAAREPTMAEAGLFMDELQRRTGRARSHLLSYLPRWWWTAHGGQSKALGGTMLWASRYNLPIDWTPYAGFAAVAIMQYADDAPITGVGMGDMNEWRGTLGELKMALGFKLDAADKRWIEATLA